MKGFRFILFLSLLVVGVQASAQSGNYFLSHYTPSDEKIDYLNFDIAQKDNGVIYFANKSGVIEFDGRNWNVIETPGAIYTLAIVNGKEIYAGGLTGYGKIGYNDENVLAFTSLSEKGEVRNIFASKILNNRIYFLSESALFVYDFENKKNELTIRPSGTNTYNGIFVLDGSLFVTDSNGGLNKLEGNKLVSNSLSFLAGDEILFSSKLPDAKRFLIGTSGGKLFSYEEGKAKEIILSDSDYLQTNVLVSGKWVNEKLIALGTLSGGVVFVNANSGVIDEIINYYTGLPDNEVYALMTDRNQGVWVAHDYGFTRIAPYLPFRTFNHYPGLTGNLLCATSVGSQVYVGTSVGLYKLTKEEVYDEETYYVTKLKKTQSSQVEETEQKKSRKGLFSFLRRGKNKEEEEKEQTKTSTKKIIEKRTRRVLRALDYSYKKVEGIDGKVTHLMKMGDRLIAAGVGGVFVVSDLKSKEVISIPVRTIFYSPTLNQLLVSTYNDRVRTYSYAKDDWQETHLLDTLREYIGNIFEDHVQNIWLCGRAEVVKVELIDKAISTISHVPFASPVLDETTGFALGPEVFVAASGAFHRYDVIKHEFIKYDSLPGPRKYFASTGSFWFNDGHYWRTVDRKLQNAMKLEWLGLFPDIRSLTLTDNDTGLWLITSNNELYKFTSSDLLSNKTKYPLFLREVRGQDSRLPPLRVINVDEQESALAFEFIQPEYTSAQAIEYQYMIQGISKDWSDWSANNNVINFPYLTPGQYKLNIKSRDLFGQLSDLQTIDFTVIPPYWQRTWFYAAEFIFFGSLVLLSMRLGASNSRYRFLSQLLSILTVIMLIQFIQTAAESMITVQTTPVVDFFIQVFIALLVLPLEDRMRRFMIEASEGKYKLKDLPKGLRK